MQTKPVVELDTEDQKLITLARAARARIGAAQGAAVRDTDGRTYAAATVDMPSLHLSALQVALAMAATAGAGDIEAAAVFGDDTHDPVGLATLRFLSQTAPVYQAGTDGLIVTLR